MDEIDECHDYYIVFDDDYILSKTDWDSVLSDSASTKNGKKWIVISSKFIL